MNKQFVTRTKFDEMISKLSVQSLSERGICKSFFWLNKEYVATGAISSAQHGGWYMVWAYQIIDLVDYKGTLEPLERSEHHREVDKGNRQRGYEGQIARTGKREIVFVGPQLEFTVSELGQQLTIF